jgi:hypothetical protein
MRASKPVKGSVQAVLLDVQVQILNEASKRARWIIILIVTASALFFSSYWNSREESWFRLRAGAIDDAITFGVYDPEYTVDPTSMRADEYARALHALDFIRTRGLQLRPRQSPAAGSIISSSPVAGEAARGEAEKRGTDASVANPNATIATTPASLIDGTKEGSIEAYVNGSPRSPTPQLLELQRARNQIVNEKVSIISVPFFGISLDINDLGLYSGFTFTLLLMMYWFSLSRERDSLKYVFAHYTNSHECRGTRNPDSGAISREDVYNLLSATQVLEVPPPIYPEQSPSLIRRYMNKFMALPPALIQGLIIANDMSSRAYGNALSEEQTLDLLMLSSSFFALILALTVACLMVHGEIGHEWKRELTEIQKERERIKTSPASQGISASPA